MRYLWLCCFIVFSCNSERQLDVQGHRGFRGLHPENTLPAFKKALNLGVQTLEMNVVISKDKQVVVSYEPFMHHDIVLDIFGNEISQELERSYNLYAMTYDSIKRYDCGTKEQMRFPFQNNENAYKPLLTEVIDLAENESNKSIVYNIEIMSKPEYDLIYTPRLEGFVQLVLDVVDSKDIQDRTILQSNDVRALELVKQRNPKLQISLIVEYNQSIDEKLSKLSFIPDIISPYFKLLDQQTVSKLQEKGFKIIPWTVNEVGDINLMIDLNVDGIISDYPNKVIQLKKLKKRF